MKTRLYVFSSTGNGFAVARCLAGELGETDVVSLPRALARKELEVDADRVGFILPVYCFGLPRFVFAAIEQLIWKDHPYCFGIIHCAGTAGAAGVQLEQALAACGQRLSAELTLLMPGNYTPLRGAESESAQQKKFDVMKAKLHPFAESVKDRDWVHPFSLLRPFHQILARLQPFIMSRFTDRDGAFTVDKTCTGCGLCSRVCPVANIELQENRPVWKGHCEHCMGCLQWCPEEAIQYGRMTRGRARYHHPEITASELGR